MDFVEHNQAGLDDDILSSMMAFLGGAIHHYSSLAQQPSLNHRAFLIVREQLSATHRSQAGSEDRVTCLINSLIGFAQTGSHVRALHSWYTQESLEELSFPLSYYNKWAIVRLVMTSKAFSRE